MKHAILIAASLGLSACVTTPTCDAILDGAGRCLPTPQHRCECGLPEAKERGQALSPLQSNPVAPDVTPPAPPAPPNVTPPDVTPPPPPPPPPDGPDLEPDRETDFDAWQRWRDETPRQHPGRKNRKEVE